MYKRVGMHKAQQYTGFLMASQIYKMALKLVLLGWLVEAWHRTPLGLIRQLWTSPCSSHNSSMGRAGASSGHAWYRLKALADWTMPSTSHHSSYGSLGKGASSGQVWYLSKALACWAKMK